MRIIRAAGLVPQPWRNGLGTTRPIHAEAGWQIGVAELGGEAAFSPFEGQDRAFTLIEGPGATLELAGRGPLPCRPLVPALFPGDVPTLYRPGGGPARAFNLIAARGAGAPRVSVAGVVGAHRLPAALAVHCVEGRLLVGGDVLEPGDTALRPGDAVEASGAATVILVLPAARG